VALWTVQIWVFDMGQNTVTRKLSLIIFVLLHRNLSMVLINVQYFAIQVAITLRMRIIIS
jgi:hypothetical protein